MNSTMRWEFLPVWPQPPQVFSVCGLRLYFLALEPWVVWSVLLRSCPSWFISTRMWNHPLHSPPPRWVCQPLPCRESSLPGCLSLPLLRVRRDVSSLSPWLSDFHTVQFSVSSGCFLFLNCCCASFGCVRRHSVCTYTSSWPEVLFLIF